eukprot:Gb_38734 [translate_table: standard]
MGAGKSSLVLRFVKGQFLDYQVESTIGAAFFSQTLAVNETTVKFEIWDTAGQERYHSLAPMYYRGAAAAIIVYDVTNLVGRLLRGHISIMKGVHGLFNFCLYPPALNFLTAALLLSICCWLSWKVQSLMLRQSIWKVHSALVFSNSLASLWYMSGVMFLQNGVCAGSYTWDSFVRAKNWVQELQKQGNPNLVMALAGNKADMAVKRKVEAEDSSSFLWIWGCYL